MKSRLSECGKVVKLSISLTPELADKVRMWAKETHGTVSSVVRNLVLLRLRQEDEKENEELQERRDLGKM
jgi:Arc/MetJ-type ribon-helix-helix transcriptional regulator